MLYWARKRLKKRCILVKPDPVSLMNRIAGEVELGQLREFVLVSRLIWVVDTMQWILDCEKGGCVYCNKYAQHGHLPRVMVSAKAFLTVRANSSLASKTASSSSSGNSDRSTWCEETTTTRTIQVHS